MTYAIEQISYYPTTCEKLYEPNACEVTFHTTGHGEVHIQTGGKGAKPKTYTAHVEEAAWTLAHKHPKYQPVVQSTWGG